MQNDRSIIVREKGRKIVVRDQSRTTILRGQDNVRILEVARQGPPGKNSDAFEWITQTFDLSNPQQEFLLDSAPRTGSVFVYLNGLLERFWAIAGLTLTLDDSALAGDSVVVSYQKEI